LTIRENVEIRRVLIFSKRPRHGGVPSGIGARARIEPRASALNQLERLDRGIAA